MLKILGIVALVLVAALVYGDWRWRQDTRLTSNALITARAGELAVFDANELTGLPEPAVRFFRRSLSPGVRVPRVVRHTQVGEFAMNGWRAMRAQQVHVTSPPGFVWDARMAMMPGMTVRVRDQYSAGQGSLLARLFGLVTVASAPNSPTLAEAALQRYLGEAIWFPAALLPGQGVVWTPIDATSARATLDDHGVTASLDFRFTPEGDIATVYTARRFQQERGRYQPWEAKCWAWETHDGMRVPMESEVAWIEDGKRVPYWRARISQLSYENP